MKMYKTKEALHWRQTNGYELNLKYTEKNYEQKVTHLRGSRKRNTNFDSLHEQGCEQELGCLTNTTLRHRTKGDSDYKTQEVKGQRWKQLGIRRDVRLVAHEERQVT